MELVIINNTVNLGNMSGSTSNLFSDTGRKLARFTVINITPVAFMLYLF